MSQLRLTGSGGGNTILNGNDTITTDQTFEFPDDGGTLVTGDKDSTGSGGSSGSAQVVGYQQGAWTPTLETGTLSDITSAIWHRIGNTVTIQAKISGFSDTTSANLIRVEGVPYGTADTVVIGCTRYDRVAAGSNAPMSATLSANSTITFQKMSNSAAMVNTSHADLDGSTSHITFTITYRTSNTTWAPGNSATVS